VTDQQNQPIADSSVPDAQVESSVVHAARNPRAVVVTKAHSGSKPLGKLQHLIAQESFRPNVHAELELETAAITIENLSLWYGKKQALFDVTLNIPKGKVTALIGPSGCGKSTLLRSVNRMNDLNPAVAIKGDIRLGEKSIFDRSIDVTELRKRLGMVFQKPNPFPRSIFDNIVYPLRIEGIRDKALLRQVCEQSLKSAALWDEVKDRLHDNGLGLSGGQQQRLCIARAIAAAPEVLLLDEPCSALDPIATSKIEDLIDVLRGDFTVLIVTHNMQQAARISDYTAFMYLGRVIEYGLTSKIFTKPNLVETEDYVTGRFG
jgi:phosphate transport system ATP-binding protein